MSNFEPKRGDREDVMEALREATGFETVRTRTGFDEAGNARYAEGYEAMADGGVKFFNEKGQEVHVPKHRVDEALASSKPEPAPEGDEGGQAPASPTKPAATKPAATK